DLMAPNQRLEFIAKLLVLLADLKEVIRDYVADFGVFANDGSRTRALRNNRGKSDERGVCRGSQEACMSAKLVAALNGQVTVIGPVPNIVQQKSPFCFRGMYSCSSNCAMPVVCKVWREGDRNYTRRRVEDEMNMLEQASKGGVPTPAVYSNLNMLDVHFRAEVYHVLVMSYIEDEAVHPRQLSQYALSLVQAVQRLHQIGILHCDIKPGNVLWNAREGLYLIDFEHAQLIEGAKYYRSTRQFTAPEILHEKQPHSIKSDCFSVGETLRSVYNSCKGNENTGLCSETKVRDVFEGLTRTVPFERLSLDNAIWMLESDRLTLLSDTLCRWVRRKRQFGDRAESPTAV
ncbi:MAG: protein kinase domain-containing protein, partial [Gaiellaceae bacterium]